MKHTILLFLLTSCAYVYQPSVKETDAKYEAILSNCRDEAQPGLMESITGGMAPIAAGSMFPDSIPTRIDKCLQRHGYEVAE